MTWCLRCGGSYGFRPINEHVCNPRDIAREELRTAQARRGDPAPTLAAARMAADTAEETPS